MRRAMGVSSELGGRFGRRAIDSAPMQPAAARTAPSAATLLSVALSRPDRRRRRRGVRGRAPSPTPPIVPGAIGGPARGQPHRQGLRLPARRRSTSCPARPCCCTSSTAASRSTRRSSATQSVQDAWEVAEAATAGAPPGPTPVVSVPPDVAGLRIVVESGERVDVIWTVPAGVRRSRRPARRLPHPRPLGAGDAGPRPLGRAAS